jgi:hypothetical protein
LKLTPQLAATRPTPLSLTIYDVVCRIQTQPADATNIKSKKQPKASLANLEKQLLFFFQTTNISADLNLYARHFLHHFFALTFLVSAFPKLRECPKSNHNS